MVKPHTHRYTLHVPESQHVCYADGTRFQCAFDAPGRTDFLSASNVPDVSYDVKALYNGHSPTLAQAADASPVRYAMMR